MAALHARRLAREAGGRTFYWADDRGREVDVVVSTKDILLPIEVKYSERVTARDLAGMKHFCKRYGSTRGVVVTRGMHGRIEMDGLEVQAVPLWMFMLCTEFG